MTPEEATELLELDQPLWVQLTGSNRVWRFGGRSNGWYTALHHRDGLCRLFQADEVVEVFTHYQDKDTSYLGSNWLVKVSRHR